MQEISPNQTLQSNVNLFTSKIIFPFFLWCFWIRCSITLLSSLLHIDFCSKIKHHMFSDLLIVSVSNIIHAKQKRMSQSSELACIYLPPNTFLLSSSGVSGSDKLSPWLAGSSIVETSKKTKTITHHIQLIISPYTYIFHSR